MNQMSFYSLLQANINSLKEKLLGLTIPNDTVKIQQIVCQSLEEIFDENSEVRLSLTQSEDYILQAAMSLLTAQQKYAMELTNFEINTDECSTTFQSDCSDSSKHFKSNADKNFITKDNCQIVAGTAIGALAGKMAVDLLTPKAVSVVTSSAGAWGAVFGAIAGTALILYHFASKSKEKGEQLMLPTIEESKKSDNIKGTKLNIDNYLSIVGEICKSVDSLIETYRSQIKRVVNHYENQEKPSLEKEYRILLENIQSLIGYKQSHSQAEEKYIQKIEERIADLSESLENYNIQVVVYDGTNDNFFNKVQSLNVTAPRMVLPAFVKDNVVILYGKVFVKE